jgi:hypothetical protein
MVARFNLDGSLSWAKAWNYYPTNVAKGIRLTSDGKVHLIGQTGMDYNGSALLHLALDQNGQPLYSRYWGEPGVQFATGEAVKLADDGALLVTGRCGSVNYGWTYCTGNYYGGFSDGQTGGSMQDFSDVSLAAVSGYKPDPQGYEDSGGNLIYHVSAP